MIKKLFTLCLSALLLSFASGLSSPAAADVLKLSSKTPVLIQSEKLISAATDKEGGTAVFRTVNTIRDDYGFTLIPSGTVVRGKIIQLDKKNRIGRPAELYISNFYAVLDNGQTIHFNGQVYKKSKSRMARSIVLSAVIFPLFLLMRGTAVELPAGSQTSVYPSSDYQM